MVTGYSRWLSAMLIPTRSAADLFAGWWQLIETLGAVPRVLVWDGEGAIGRWRGGPGRAHRRVPGVPRDAGREGDGLQARRPRSEGPGRALPTTIWSGRSCRAGRSPRRRTSTASCSSWLSVVNTRQRRALGCAPTDRIVADRAAMLALPPVAPATGWRSSTRLARDHYVRLDGNDYSVHPVGDRPPHRDASPTWHRVRVLCDGRVVADHERIWAWHQTISDPDHVGRGRSAAPRACRGRCARSPNPRSSSGALSDYDTALGIDGLDGGVA